MTTTAETEGGAVPDAERVRPAARAGQWGRRNRGRLVRLFAALLAVGVVAAAGGLWVKSLPPGTGILSGLRDAGVPVPEQAIVLLETPSAGSDLPEPQPATALPPLEEPSALPPDAAPQSAGAGELAAAIERIEAGMGASLAGIRSDLAEQGNAISGLTGEVERLSGLVSEIEADRAADASLLQQALDEAAQARREAGHARNLIEASAGDRDARLGMLEEDVQAVAASLRTLRHMQASTGDRIDAVAADLHLLVRFGDGPGGGDAATAGPASTTTTAPWQTNYYATADAAAGESGVAPESLVQGKYRVGDWVVGWGVVTAIRKTPEGDHLTTPRGTLFAPAPSSGGD